MKKKLEITVHETPAIAHERSLSRRGGEHPVYNVESEGHALGTLVPVDVGGAE